MTSFELRSSLAAASIFGLRMFGMFVILPVFALYAAVLEPAITEIVVRFANAMNEMGAGADVARATEGLRRYYTQKMAAE